MPCYENLIEIAGVVGFLLRLNALDKRGEVLALPEVKFLAQSVSCGFDTPHRGVE